MDLRKVTRPVFERAADALEHSADLADDHAASEERAGRHDYARDERARAAWARQKARRARARARTLANGC
jgi:hypothetical protein